MSLPTLHTFRQVSPECEAWVVTDLDLTFNIALARYVNDSFGLRATLRMLQGVISGSFVLSFLLRTGTPFTPSDMDIYLPRQYAARMAMYLVEVEGYTHTATSAVPYGRRSAHEPVLVLSKGSMRIDIIPSVNDNALYPISHFWGSHVMNYLTADSFCVAYPTLTFASRSLLSPFQLIHHNLPSAYILSLVAKYSARGFDFRIRPYAWNDLVDEDHSADISACPRVRRFFGDRYCLMGAMSRAYGEGGYARMLPSPSTVCWWRGGAPCGDDCGDSEVFAERRVPTAYVLQEKLTPVDL